MPNFRYNYNTIESQINTKYIYLVYRQQFGSNKASNIEEKIQITPS